MCLHLMEPNCLRPSARELLELPGLVAQSVTQAVARRFVDGFKAELGQWQHCSLYKGDRLNVRALPILLHGHFTRALDAGRTRPEESLAPSKVERRVAGSNPGQNSDSGSFEEFFAFSFCDNDCIYCNMPILLSVVI